MQKISNVCARIGMESESYDGVCRQQKWEFWVAGLAESFSPR